MKKRVRDSMYHRKDRGYLNTHTHTHTHHQICGFQAFCFIAFPSIALFLLHHGEGCPLQAGKHHEEDKEGDDEDNNDGRKLMCVTNTLHMFTQICSLRHHCVNCCWDNLFSTREKDREFNPTLYQWAVPFNLRLNTSPSTALALALSPFVPDFSNSHSQILSLSFSPTKK